MKNIFFSAICLPFLLFASINHLPILHEGRIRPVGTVYDNITLDDFYQESFQTDLKPTLTQPLITQLRHLKGIQVIPSRQGDFFPLQTLLLPLDNFTPFDDALYMQLRLAVEKKDPQFVNLLLKGYQTLSEKTWQNDAVKTLMYPSLWQLKAELYLYKIPVFIIIFISYLLSFLAILLLRSSYRSLIFPLILQTIFLSIRCYILQRPPVSNMMETVLFVSFIITLSAVCSKDRIKSMLAALSSALLFLLLILLKYDMELTTLQPVLDSNFWLTVHVLLVVGSYGFFLLSGLLGHLYLIQQTFQGRSPSPKPLLHTMYIGVAMLITGTLLGGVWAAESWGRFWDWDPKEAWAFILISIYLAIIHQYTFKKIAAFGLNIGAVIGMTTMTFTWYGVNYLLGTGLHSYGFGSGGTSIYLTYLGCELIFLTLIGIFHAKNQRTRSF